MKTKNKIDPGLEETTENDMSKKKKQDRRSFSGRVEKRSEGRQSKVSLRRRINHLLRRTKSGSSAEHDELNNSQIVPEEVEKLEDVEEQLPDEEVDSGGSDLELDADGGALSLADLESEQLSPFVTRRAGSTPKLFKVQQNVSIPKSVQKAIGLDVKKSSTKKRSRHHSSPNERTCSPSGFFSSITSRTSLKDFRRSRSKEFSSSGASLKDFRRSKSKEFSSSGTSESGSKVFARDAGSTPCRSRQSFRSSGKENRQSKRRSSNFGASLDLKESENLTGSDSVKKSAKKSARVCHLVNENLFCISGMSALTINTPPSAYRKMAFGHSMLRRSMTKQEDSDVNEEKVCKTEGSKSDKKRKKMGKSEEFDMSVYAASPKIRVRKRLSLTDLNDKVDTEPSETDFPYEGDSILARGPSGRLFRRNSLRESQRSVMANTMNATISSLHSIMEDTELTTFANTTKAIRSSLRNTSVVSAAAAPTSHFLTPNTKLRKSAKHRNASSTATCTRHDKKCTTPEQPSAVKASVKRSKSVTFSSKKEVAAGKQCGSEKRQKSLSLRRRPQSASKEPVRVEMREDAGHTPKPTRKKQEPIDERLI